MNTTPADIDDDGIVGPSDLAQLLGQWGPCKGPCSADLDGDGLVNAADLAQRLSNGGECD